MRRKAMMAELDEQAILRMINQRTAEIGMPSSKAKKYSGAVTVGVIAEALGKCGVRCSRQDVYIKTLAIEFDLVVPRPGSAPKYGILYEPEDVLAVLEVKKLGSFGQPTIDKVRNDFRAVRQANPRATCAYVTVTEGKRYRYKVTAENVEANAYTLVWTTGSGTKRVYEPTGDWAKLVADLHRLLQRPSLRSRGQGRSRQTKAASSRRTPTG